ncbi:MAG TPA: FAD-dependent oxidoreductase [Rhabdochlamydiaceae bacterium]|nr:FAD-dependent oxidoreductase [Rhabdochlamydiaceae bacterium]
MKKNLISIVGGGIIGVLEAYYAYKEAQKKGVKPSMIIYEKSDSIASSTNTAYNIVPSLTIDDILSVVPRGSELAKKLSINFSQPGGIRIDDVEGVNDSEAACNFKKAVAVYGNDPQHDDRTLALLTLGRKSMDLWQEMYDEGDEKLKAILEASHFHPCREPKNTLTKQLRDGYRIDLILNVPQAQLRAEKMIAEYEKLGYEHCALLSPDEVIALDPHLTDFCLEYSILNKKRTWRSDSIALWRPGGSINTRVFIPQFYAYLQHLMGQDRFKLQLGKEVVGLEWDGHRIAGLKFNDGAFHKVPDSHYIFCPGESVGTLPRLGFHEPAYAGFAGASLLMKIPLTPDRIEKYRDFVHSMEVHSEEIVLAWQAHFKDDHIFLGVGGTKAFYGDKHPHKNEKFAQNRAVLQLNLMNQVLPGPISQALGYPTHGKAMTAEELSVLEKNGIAERWVGRRAIVYDGFPTLGALYKSGCKVDNARCTTHMGSGGVSMGPAAVLMSRTSEQAFSDPFSQKILLYADSRRKH